MNLVGTLAKVAMGMMVARGVGKMMGGKPAAAPAQNSGGGGGLGGLLGGLTGGGAQKQQSDGGLGGLGGLLSGLNESTAQKQSGGGLGDLLGGILSGGGAQAQQQSGGQSQGSQSQGGGLGGLGGLLESLAGGKQQQNGGGLGDIFNKSLAGERVPEPEPDQNAQAKIMLRGMINAAKSDGDFDVSEQDAILEHLGGDDVTEEEVDFVRNEMSKPLDVDGFVASVPKGLEQQVYLMSLLGIKLDSQAEAQYLDRLAKGIGISPEMSNRIHEQVGVPTLYG